MGSTGTTGGATCAGSPPGTGYWCSYGAWMPPSGGGGSGTGCPAPTFNDKPSCTAYCMTNKMMGVGTTDAMCEPICDDFDPCGYSGRSGGGGVGGQATPEVQAACRDRCNATGKYSQSNCQMYCEDRDFEGAGGGSTGDMSATCTACITAGGTQMSCLTCPGYTGGGGWSTGQMRRCFYPNASINGVKASFTVWCEGDYVNCHEGEPSGRSVPNAGLSLGAPSTCDSGTGGNGGGATSYAECVAKECA